MFKTKFSGHNKIWGSQKIGGTAPECPPAATWQQLGITFRLSIILQRLKQANEKAAEAKHNYISQT